MDYMDNFTVDLSNYTCSDKGLVLPLFSEYTWPIEVRAGIYCVALGWCFLGVAIVADTFMCSIEKITSKTRIIKIAKPDGVEEIEVQVWNDTVANLTLMALGSSAPEILLSCIELIGNKFESKDLGPSTIVGSAAFNLLVITAVCMVSIPSPEIRRIKHIKVFMVTATFSIFAYVWLIVILVAITPNVVDLWEAIITFLLFPALVLLAYLADRDFCKRKKPKDDPEVKAEIGRTKQAVALLQNGASVDVEDYDSDDEIDTQKMTSDRMRMMMKSMSDAEKEMPDDMIAKMGANKVEEGKTHHHLWYRINATRAMGGNPSLLYKMHELEASEEERQADYGDIVMGTTTTDLSEDSKKAVVEFTAFQSAILECEKVVKLGILRWGNIDARVVVKIETIDGTAEAGSDYIPIKKTLIFEKGEKLKQIDITVVDDNVWEPDEVFFAKLSVDLNDPNAKIACIGRKAVQEIIIINDDEPGTFQFTKPSLLFKESEGKALIPIERTNGGDGRVEISWKTEDMTAKNGLDFIGGTGTVVFEHGEMTKMLELKIIDDKEKEKDECFKVDLVDCSEGAKLGRVRKTIVSIVNDDDFDGMVSRLVDMVNMNVDALRVDTNTYADQFRNALNVNGGDIENASNMDYVMHFCTFAWKVLFAFIPPVSMCGGWLTFCVSLSMIGLLTMIVGDLAGIFGCLVGLKDSVTAITFVALGTSLPDLFASKQAATMEKTADNSIGNVTGSNSVNVFLGLGLPWLLATIYWGSKGKDFKVQAGSLSFSVLVYSICAAVCIAALMLRRNLRAFGKGELGGNFAMKIVCAVVFVCLWMLYIVLSALQAYGQININF